MPQLFDEPENEDAAEMLENLEAFQTSVPDGRYVTIRHEANPPVFVALLPDENTITISEAIERRGLTINHSVTAYVDNQTVELSHQLAPGQVATLIGAVKGG